MENQTTFGNIFTVVLKVIGALILISFIFTCLFGAIAVVPFMLEHAPEALLGILLLVLVAAVAVAFGAPTEPKKRA
jgi:hypothetical protein